MVRAHARRDVLPPARLGRAQPVAMIGPVGATDWVAGFGLAVVPVLAIIRCVLVVRQVSTEARPRGGDAPTPGSRRAPRPPPTSRPGSPRARRSDPPGTRAAE